jgi:hypothetical protein
MQFNLSLNLKQAAALQKGTEYYRLALLKMAKAAPSDRERTVYTEEFLIINRIDLDLGMFLHPGRVVFKEEQKYEPKKVENVLTYDSVPEHDVRQDVFG